MRWWLAVLAMLTVGAIAGAGDAAHADGGRPEARISEHRLISAMAALTRERSVRGSIESQQGLVLTEEWILRQLRGMGYEPTTQDLSWNLKKQQEAEAKAGPTGRPPVQTTDELASRTWRNIIVEIPGRDLPREVLIYGAHFDAVPCTPGADDNATGTAALLEIARVLKDVPMRRTVRLIFFNLEEIGLRGSRDYVASIRPRIKAGEETVIGMVSLEMLGYFSDKPGSQASPLPPIEGVFDPPTVGDFIGLATIAKHAPFCRKLDSAMRAAAPELKTFVADFPPIAPPDFLRSDHAPFLLAGIPAIMLTDTSNFRNPHYHKPTDTPETIDLERFTLVVRGLAGAAYTLAEPAEEPRK